MRETVRGPEIARQATQSNADLRRLELLSAIEATTLILLLFIAVPLKHLMGMPGAVKVMGTLHGLAFLTFVWFGFQAVAEGGWTVRDRLRLFLGAVLPFGGFVNAAWLRRRSRGAEAEP